MKKLTLALLALLLVFTAVFAGCSKGENFAPSPAYDGASANYNEKEAFSYHGGAAVNDSPSDATEPKQDIFAGRKVIRNANLTIETLEFDKFMENMISKVNLLGGYIQSNEVRNRGYNYTSGMRYAETTVRIPADKLDEFLAVLDGMGNITYRTESVDDVTDTYVDIEARLSSLRTEYDTLLELLSRADSLETIITLQDRLADVRYQIESYEARQRNYDSLVAYSTVKMTINEVETESPVGEESFGEEVSRRFSDSLKSVGEGFRAFAVWFIGDSPSILLSLIVLGLIALIVILIVRASNKKKRERQKKYLAAKAAETVEENK